MSKDKKQLAFFVGPDTVAQLNFFEAENHGDYSSKREMYEHLLVTGMNAVQQANAYYRTAEAYEGAPGARRPWYARAWDWVRSLF